MQLIMKILNPSQDLPAEARCKVFTTCGGSIGRNPESTWYIPDASAGISRRHANISYRGKTFNLIDMSSNGIWLLDDGSKLEKSTGHPIKNGETYQFHNLMISAHLVDEADLTATDQVRQASVYNLIGEDYAVTFAVTDDHPIAFDSDSQDDLSVLLHTEEPAMQQDDHTGIETQHLHTPTLVNEQQPRQTHAVQAAPPLSLFWQTFGNALGTDLNALSEAERQAVAIKAAHLLRDSTSGLQQCVQTCLALKQEMAVAGSPELDDEHHAQALRASPVNVLEQLLRSPQPQARLYIKYSLRELQIHQLAALTATRAALRGLFEQLSPGALILRLEETSRWRWLGAANPWRAYARWHRQLSESNRDPLPGSDFAQAYAEQQRLLATLTPTTAGEP